MWQNGWSTTIAELSWQSILSSTAGALRLDASLNARTNFTPCMPSVVADGRYSKGCRQEAGVLVGISPNLVPMLAKVDSTGNR